MTLASRDRPRRTNRPRRPTSVVAGLSLTAMGLLFVGLLGVTGITWLTTTLSGRGGGAPRPQQQFFGPAPFPPAVAGPGAPNPNGPFINPGPPAPRFNDDQAIKIALTKGAFHGRALLANSDPRDGAQHPGNNGAVVNMPCKVFLVELQAGKRYTFEYKRNPPLSNSFDPYLRIENLQGERLIEFDDIDQGRDLDVRFDWAPPKTATYRIFCTLFQAPLPGQPGFVAPDPPPPRWDFNFSIREAGAELPPVQPILVNKVTLPKASAAGRPLAATRTSDNDLSAAMLTKLPGKDAPIQGDVCWSADGKDFFALCSGGTLLRVAADGFVEKRRLELGRHAEHMAMSGEGLVVSIPSLGEIWLINADDLEVKKRFAVLSWSPEMRIATSPKLNYALVAAPPQNPPGGPPVFGIGIPNNPAGPGPMPFVGPKGMKQPLINQPPGKAPPGKAPADKESRRGVAVVSLRQDQPFRLHNNVPNQSLAVMPDGSHFFAMNGDVLTRFTMDPRGEPVKDNKDSFKLGAAGKNGFRINISPDGRFVCATGSEGKDAQLPDDAKVGPGPVFVYPVDNLLKPAFGFGTGKPAHALGFDVRTERVFASAGGKPLVVYDFEGRKLSEHMLGDNAGADQEALQFLPHPDGNKLLVRFRSKLCYVAFKRGIAPLAKANLNVPPPVEVKDAETVAAAPVKIGDMTYRELQLPNPSKVDPCWDADGDGVFYLDTEGTVTRVSARDFMPKKRLPLGRPAAAMAISAKGLLVALRDQPEVWVIDPLSLEVQSRIVCSSQPRFLAAHPKLAIAAAVGDEVGLLDLNAGKVAARGLQDHPDAGLRFENPALAPDGTHLFLAYAKSGTSKVVRVKVEPDRLVIEDSRATTVKGVHDFCVTADGQYVAWYSKRTKQETAFYPVIDWKAPAFTLPVQARAMGCAADGSLYVHTHLNQTVRFARPADKGPVDLRWPEGRIRDFVVHPREPGVFLACTDGRVFHVELVKK
jgi:hypothetical protein